MMLTRASRGPEDVTSSSTTFSFSAGKGSVVVTGSTVVVVSEMVVGTDVVVVISTVVVVGA